MKIVDLEELWNFVVDHFLILNTFWASNKQFTLGLPSAFFLALGKDVFCRVPLFWHSTKRHFAVCIFLALGKSVFQSNFWGPKWIQMKNFSTTKLYNFSRSIKFILVISSFDKATIMLFIKSTSLISFMKVEERYIRFVNNVTTTMWMNKWPK